MHIWDWYRLASQVRKADTPCGLNDKRKINTPVTRGRIPVVAAWERTAAQQMRRHVCATGM